MEHGEEKRKEKKKKELKRGLKEMEHGEEGQIF